MEPARPTIARGDASAPTAAPATRPTATAGTWARAERAQLVGPGPPERHERRAIRPGRAARSGEREGEGKRSRHPGHEPDEPEGGGDGPEPVLGRPAIEEGRLVDVAVPWEHELTAPIPLERLGLDAHVDRILSEELTVVPLDERWR